MHNVADTADLDNGPRTGKSGTERMCFVSRSVRPIDELIRFVVAPTGEAVPDLKRKLPGRGLWLTANRATIAEAVKRNAFTKGFRKPVIAPVSLPQDTDDLMIRGLIEALAMTAKAGQITSGFTKVEDALRHGQVTALIHASDGAPDGIRKLAAVARSRAAHNMDMSDAHGDNDDDDAFDDLPEDLSDDMDLDDDIGQARYAAPVDHGLPVITVLTSEQIDLALSRSNVIHAAVLAGPASKTFLSRCQTLVRYRMADDGKTGVGIKAKSETTPLATEGSTTVSIAKAASGPDGSGSAEALVSRTPVE